MNQVNPAKNRFVYILFVYYFYITAKKNYVEFAELEK